MIWSKWSAVLTLSIIAVSIIVATLTGWSVFAQAAVLGVGLILAAIVPRPTLPAILLSIIYVACVFLLALIESGSKSKVLPVWLYGGLAIAYWFQIQSGRRFRCCR